MCHSEKLPCGFILLRTSVWYMTNMIEQICLTLRILVTNLVTRDVSRCIICDCIYCSSNCYIVYWLYFQNLEMRNMTGFCLESFTPVNKNFASPKLCTRQHHYSWPLVGFSSRNFEWKERELRVCWQPLQNNRNCISVWSEIKM